jgi:hypothetical protein
MPFLFSYAQALLSIARSLINQGHFNIAIVTSHMACEVATEKALGAAFASRGIADLEEAVEALMNGYNLANDRHRKLYCALARDDIHKQPFWQQFKESAEGRNKIIHKGANASKVEAESSLKAAIDLVAHLKQ